ncbi:C4-dicarboxylate transporter/malic acid transport protein [Aspergillus uvarum CBS 121591]|uniref:C4-dicarboxylate transporter/malic acid transport protein n=1 Tax=Aspergillus uvarum CBS 121591 TaxID=1448315 RepID=A0A319CX92_9EURO|nr:C4-dicarboxylate transporter/malic acid transport protein [Aspergillus uvarum CBS 121591]PYH83543.1 C4-dicarboxylate transporter/malic acid transport protein [Aspergillus uvarum CBS 121591]
MDNAKVTFLDRICRVTWGWFSISMSTGSIATLLYNCPHKFDGLLVIGKIFFILDIVTYLGIWTSLIIRFSRFRHALVDTFDDPEESYLIATAALGFATILFGIEVYGIPACGVWLRWVQLVCFWIYTAIAICLAVGMNWHLYRTRMAARQPFWLVRLLPSFPAMLGGTIASLLTSAQPSHYAIPMLIAGTALQGFGFMISVFILAEYIYGLHHQGLPPMRRRPQMFIAVGPPAFTAVALMGMAQTATEKFPTHLIPLASQVNTADVLLVMAVFVSIFLWVVALFFWSIGWLSIFDARREWKFDITWWATVFPNTGFALAIIKIGDLLDSSAIQGVGTAATLIQVILWLGCASMHIWAYFSRRTLWPGMDEGFGPDEHQHEAALDLEGEVRSYKGSSSA